MAKFEPVTIDEMLDNIDLKFSNYEPSVDAIEFFNIIRFVQGKDFEHKNAKVHYFMVDMFYGNVKRREFPFPKYMQERISLNFNDIAIACSRGLAKSTVTTLFFPLVCAIKGETPYLGKFNNMLILSDTQDGGAKSQYEVLKNFCELNKKRLDGIFERIETKDNKIMFIRIGKTDDNGKPIEPESERCMQVVFKGAQSGGIRSGSRNPISQERYGLIIGDDVIARESDALSSVIMGKVKSALFSDAEHAMRSGKKQMILVNTLYTKSDPIYSTIESGAYCSIVVPRSNKMYEGIKKEEWVGAWEEYHPFKDTYESYLKAVLGEKEREYNQEIQCRISDEKARIVSDKHIKWYKRNSIIKQLDNMNIYVTTDLTSTDEDDHDGDYSAIAIWAVDWKKNFYLLELQLKKVGIRQQYDNLFDMLDRYTIGGRRYAEISVEVDGNQRAHLIAIEKEMQIRNKYYNFAREKGIFGFGTTKGILSKKFGRDKLERFKNMSTMFKMDKIFFPVEIKGSEDMSELLNEIRYTTWNGIKSKHDDGIDVLNALNHIEITYPSQPIDDSKNIKKINGANLTAGEALFRMMNKNNDNTTIENDNEYSTYS